MAGRDLLRTACWRKTLRKRATWELGVAVVGFREDLSTCLSTGGSGAFGETELGTMERRPWRGMGGFTNAPAQNECSGGLGVRFGGGLGWIEALAGQYSVIPSSILTHFRKWPSHLAAWAVSALFFRSDVLEDDESTITVRACPCLLPMLRRTSVHFSRAGPQKTGKVALKRLLARPPIPEATAQRKVPPYRF